MKKIICALLIICLAFSFSACKENGEPEIVTKTRSRGIAGGYFNTNSYIYTYNDIDDTNIEKYTDIAHETLSFYHKLFDIYYEYAGINNIRTINKNAGKTPVEVDEKLIAFLEYCKELYTITNGKTNIMLGSILTIWHDCRELADDNNKVLPENALPTKEALEAAYEHTSIDLLVIDKEASTVYISDPKASIDVGAVAKGYAVDILYNNLKSVGADSVVLNIGGNIRTIGLKPDGKEWLVGITNPDRSGDADSLICFINVGECSIVTSGEYERSFTSGDTNYHHIIDPDTLYPARYFSGVSIIAEDSCLADALSTALFCMSYEDGLELVSSLGGIDVIWIDTEYNVRTTPGIKLVNNK